MKKEDIKDKHAQKFGFLNWDSMMQTYWFKGKVGEFAEKPFDEIINNLIEEYEKQAEYQQKIINTQQKLLSLPIGEERVSEVTYKDIRSIAVDFGYYMHLKKLGEVSHEKQKQEFDDYSKEKWFSESRLSLQKEETNKEWISVDTKPELRTYYDKELQSTVREVSKEVIVTDNIDVWVESYSEDLGFHKSITFWQPLPKSPKTPQ